jgi:hypothetical protein
VITHEMVETELANSAVRVGMATLTTVMSSTAMTDPSISTPPSTQVPRSSRSSSPRAPPGARACSIVLTMRTPLIGAFE